MAQVLLVVCHDLTDFKERVEFDKDRQLIATLQHEEKGTHTAQEKDAERAIAAVDGARERLGEQLQAVERYLRSTTEADGRSTGDRGDRDDGADLRSAHQHCSDELDVLAQAASIMGGVATRSRQAQNDSHQRIMLR